MAKFRTPAPRIPIKGPKEQALMRRAGRVVALALQKVGEAIRPGVTTGELDAVAEQTIRGLGAVPAFLGYREYPATACVSLNEEVVHGIPGAKLLKAGDIVSVDLGAVVEGWYADAAYTFPVGEVSEAVLRLLDAGKEALAVGIAAARPGNRVRDIGAAIQQFVESRGYSVVRDLCGHGIGQRLHEEPQVPNYVAPGGSMVLQPGMALAIEPMVNLGGYRVELLPDGWTFVTADGTLSVHFEHTVLVQPDEPEIITVLR
ncbi:MAG: type I methionyl aminopeptidase [Armatimonadota bacterium]